MATFGQEIDTLAMRKPRKFLKNPESKQFFHVTSRIVNGDQVIGSEEKVFFLKTLRKLEKFTGIKIMTYCLMDNHFHLLMKVPAPIPLKDEEIIKRMEHLYPKAQLDLFKEELKKARKHGKHEMADLMCRKITLRMFDLSMFMKDLKQRFTQWFNRRHSRRGTLWEERFRSVLLEGSKHVLMTTGAYIDLNPVRAGLCDDPKDYPFSGFGAAMRKQQTALNRLLLITLETGLSNSESVSLNPYRNYLYSVNPHMSIDGITPSDLNAFDKRKALKELSESGSLDFWQLLRCRVRYFSSGTVLGSRSFVDAFFLDKREYFGPRRTSGARRMKGGDWCGIYSLRNLAMNLYR